MVRTGPHERSAGSGPGRGRTAPALVAAVLGILLLPILLGAPHGVAQDAPGTVPADAPPPAPAPAPGAPVGEDAIVVNFEKADIREVVHSLAGALRINYLLDPRVEGQVTIRTAPGGTIPRSELFPIFNQILRSVGIAAVKVGEVYNIMPIAEAKTRVEVRDDGGMQRDDLFVIELVPVKNVAAQEMVTLLEPFITPGGDVYAYPRANLLIIADIATNVDRMREMVQLLDRDSFKELKAKIFKIEHADIDELGIELLAVLDTYGITGEAAQERGVYVIPLLRLNSIAVLAFNDDMFAAVDYWMKLLDVPQDEELTRTVRVYNVQNAKAADLAVVLNELYGGGNGSSSGQGAPQRGQPGFGGARGAGGAAGAFGAAGGAGRLGGLGGAGGAGRALGRTQQLGGGGGGLGGGGGSSRTLGGSRGGGGGLGGGRRGAQPAGQLGGAPGSGAGGGASGFVIAGGEGPLSMFQNEVRIVADEIANAIVVLATKRDYDQILKVLRDLDVVPRQVVIEVLIAEVSLNKSMELGIQSMIANPGGLNSIPTPTPGVTPTPSDTADGTASILSNSGLLNSVLQTATGATAKRFLEITGPNDMLTAVISDNSSFRVTLTALASAGRLKVLASPHILTADNREASIHIGTEIPILTSQANIAGVQGAGGQTALVNNVQYRSTGVILTVLPQVNADGLVNLQVRQEVSEVDRGFESETGSPAFTTREAETTAVVQNGDSLLIGGIIQETTSRGRSGVPYLMDIPVLGRLFRVDTDAVRRVELIVLLTPHVIRNRSESLLVTERYKDRLWDVVDEIERTSGLREPSKAELNYIRRLRSRSTEAQRPTEGLLPNRDD